mgnify:CR=1 FL=1
MRQSGGLTLYVLSCCPFCVRVRVGLRLRGISIPIKKISDHKNKSALISGGGKKQVPCLRIEKKGGEVEWLYESLDIINYIDQNNNLSDYKA